MSSFYISKYDEYYERILENKENMEEIENIIDEIKKIEEIKFRIRLKKILRFLDEEYTYNRILYNIIKKLLYKMNFDLIQKFFLIYELKITDVDKLINNIKIQEDETNYKNFKQKKLTEKQILIIEFLENYKKLIF